MLARIFWTQQARDDLRAIRAHIARDAPAAAGEYVRRLRKSVERLRDFPFSGEVVPEIGRDDIREVIQGVYRVIHRASDKRVEILTVFHGARILGPADID